MTRNRVKRKAVGGMEALDPLPRQVIDRYMVRKSRNPPYSLDALPEESANEHELFSSTVSISAW